MFFRNMMNVGSAAGATVRAVFGPVAPDDMIEALLLTSQVLVGADSVTFTARVFADRPEDTAAAFAGGELVTLPGIQVGSQNTYIPIGVAGKDYSYVGVEVTTSIAAWANVACVVRQGGGSRGA